MYSDPIKKVETKDFASLDVDTRKYVLARQDDLMASIKSQEFIEIEGEAITRSKLRGKGIKQDMVVRVRSDSHAGAEWGAGTVVDVREEGGIKYALVKFGDEAAGIRPRLVPITDLAEVSPEALEAMGFLSKAQMNEFGVSPAQLDLDEAFEIGTPSPYLSYPQDMRSGLIMPRQHRNG